MLGWKSWRRMRLGELLCWNLIFVCFFFCDIGSTTTQHQKKTPEIKVINAAMPRMGSQTIKEALSILGFPTYSMPEAALSYPHLWELTKHANDPQNLDFDYLLTGFKGVSGVPMFLYYEELLRIHPNAKVIISSSDRLEDWADRYLTLRNFLYQLRETAWFVPRIRALVDMVKKIWHIGMFHESTDKKELGRIFLIHNERVKHAVPKDQLLIYDVQEGWEPLCIFLNLPVPDAPFPRENFDGSTVRNTILFGCLLDLLYLSVFVFLLVFSIRSCTKSKPKLQ